MKPTSSDNSFFTIGGTIIRRWWRPNVVWLPWAVSAALLSLAAFWDLLDRGAGIDFIVLGLAGYELVIGLTEEEPPAFRHEPAR